MDLEEPLRPVGEVAEGEGDRGVRQWRWGRREGLVARGLPSANQGHLAPFLVLVLVPLSAVVVAPGHGPLVLPHRRGQGRDGDWSGGEIGLGGRIVGSIREGGDDQCV